MQNQTILAIDPGSKKCGVAILRSGSILERLIVTKPLLIDAIQTLQNNYEIDLLVLGSGTQSNAIKDELEKLKIQLPIVFVPEINTTIMARKLYWQLNPPKGLWRIVPTSLRLPPVPVDDLAAVVIAQEFLTTLK